MNFGQNFKYLLWTFFSCVLTSSFFQNCSMDKFDVRPNESVQSNFLPTAPSASANLPVQPQPINTTNGSNSTCVKPARFTDPSFDPCEDFGPFATDLQNYCNCKNPPTGANSGTGSSGKSCLFNGLSVPSGTSFLAYQSANVAYGLSCISQQRTCSNGSLNGSFNFVSCRVDPPAAPIDQATCAIGAAPEVEFNLTDGYLAFSTGSASTSAINNGYRNEIYPDFGNNNVLVFKMNVPSLFSTVGKNYLPGLVASNSPVTQISTRTVSVSECPNDFSSSSVLVSQGNSDFVVSFTTEINRAGNGVALVKPNKVYFLNIKNTNCPVLNPRNPNAGICHLDGQYRNWNQ